MAPSTTANLSARERFQKTVSQLNTEDAYKHKRNKSISLKYNPYELQHVSSLRVSPLRKSPHKADASSLRQISEEPDFGMQERDVWSRRSPATKKQCSSNSAFTLYNEATESSSQHEDTENDTTLLRPQIIVSAECDERPKTRRGPAGPSAFEALANTGSEIENEETCQSVRLPKFIEGTMNSRSGAVSSSWSAIDYPSSCSEAEESDSNATPKPSRRRSSSIDIRDFQPPTTTPSAIKRTLFGKKEYKKDKKIEATSKSQDNESSNVKEPKRRLRKSMSKLHFLGEKMKIFGSSAQDLPEQMSSKPEKPILDESSTLDERKRKAEAAYAEQFGYKKRRDNDGSANVTSSPDLPDRQELRGNQKFESSTVRYRGSANQTRRLSTGSILYDDCMKQVDGVGDHDARKRPSRRELEKENQKLRELLRESQAATKQAILYTSESEPIPPVPPLRIRRSSVASAHSRVSLDANFVVTDDATEVAVPPLPPQHPDRRVLGNLSNSRNRRVRRESFGIVSDSESKDYTYSSDCINPVHNPPKLVPTPTEKDRPLTPPRSMASLPRSVGVIAEEPEDDVDEKKKSLRFRTRAVGKENTALPTIGPGGVPGRSEQWQWPDDVF